MMEICHTFIISEEVLEELSKKDEIISFLGCNEKILYNTKINSIIFNKFSARYPQLGKGEVSVLCILIERNNSEDVCLFDDQKARNVADSLGKMKHGTVWFIEECYKKSIMDKNETLILLRNLRNQFFWLDKKILIDAIIRVANS